MKGESLYTRTFRTLMNLYPMFRGTGGKLIYLKSDFAHATVRIKLGIWTRNYVGTIFGGSMFAAADPFHMVLLINIIGKNYVVWDKAGKIDFKRPSKKEIRADFIYTPEEIEHIKAEVAAHGKYEFKKSVEWRDKDQNVVSIVEKTVYVATKEFHKQRQAERAAAKTT